MEAMPRPRPLHLHREVNRHGRTVWYVRIGNGSRIRIRADYGTPEFNAAYDAALRGEAIVPGQASYPAQSLGWLVARYRESTAWTALAMATRRQRENILKHVLAQAGREPISRIDRKAIVAGRDRRKDAPNAARHFVQTMNGLFDWAVDAQLAGSNPTVGVKVPRPSTEGHRVWNEAMREAYKARWPLGTRQRVWYAVLYCTGLRRGDAVRFGSQHVKGDRGGIRTEKGRHKLAAYFVIDDELRAAIKAGPVGDMTYISGARGRPLAKESFGNLFRDACEEAGVDGSAHGLRKARATYLADSGGTEAELDAMFAWKRGSGMSAVYTREADRERLAVSAAQKLNAYSRTAGTVRVRAAKSKGKSNG